MTSQDQRIALAEFEGYSEIRHYPWCPFAGAITNPPKNQECIETNEGKSYFAIPNYLHDLNAVHELEKRLTNQLGQFNKYIYELEKTCIISGWLEMSAAEKFAIIHATAPQRCEALLRTIRK